jgi:hypothetical protein
MIAMARIICSLMLLNVFGLFSVDLQAQDNPIYFPYVTNDTQISTELILTNPTNRDANVTLSRYEPEGNLDGAFIIAVPARSQAIIGSTAFPGVSWVLGSSDVSGVVGNVRVSSTDGSAQETAEAAQPDSAILLPVTTQSADVSAEITIVNPNSGNSRVALTLYAANGAVIAAADSVLPPFGILQGTLSAIFGTGKDYSIASHIIARSERQNILSQSAPVIGFEVVRGLVSSRSDFAAIAAIPISTASNSVTFSQGTRDPNWFSLVGLVNVTSSTQFVTVTYLTESNPAGLAANLAIPGNGSVRVNLTDFFGVAADSGTIRVTSSGPIAGFEASGTVGGNGIGITPGQATAATEFLLPLVDETAPSFTGIALFNGTAAAATVDLYLISPQGATLGHVARLLLPQQRISSLVREFFLEGLSQTGGFVFVRASAALFATGIIGVPDKALSQLSARPTLPGFVAAPQARFGIRGRVMDEATGTPVAGITVVLSRIGAADITTATDSNGEYLFRNLIPANYTVKPVQAGFMFAPFNPLIAIVADSRLVNFTRGPAPTISTLTVITSDADAQKTAGNNPDAFAVFGTSEVSIKIDGSNFVGPSASNAGQTVFFGSRAVPVGNVNFVDSRTLFVKLVLDSPEILSEMSARGGYGKYEITIGGQAPFIDSRSNARPFNIMPPLPVLVSVVSSSGRAETFARYEINSPGEPLVVTGFGFRPGAQLLFNGSTTVNGIQIDTRFGNSTLLEAYLPPQALRFGGNYSLRVRNQSELPEVSGEAVIFTILNLRPQITSIDPPALLLGPGPVTTYNFTVNGINFHPRPTEPADTGTVVLIRRVTATPVDFNVCPPLQFEQLTATFVSSNQLVVNSVRLPQEGEIAFPGTYQVIVANVGPGGGCSQPRQFDLVYGPTSGTPTIDVATPLSPTTQKAGSAGFNLTVYRDLSTFVPFQTDAWVNFGTVRLLRVPSDTGNPDSITVFVPGFLVASTGTVPITVTNPGTGGSTGGTSNRVYLSITP